MPPLKNCEHCNKLFVVTKKRGRFCCRACGASVKKLDRVSIACPCGNSFHVKPSRQYKAKYCSSACKRKYQSYPGPIKDTITESCKNCGKNFEVKPGRHGRKRYCGDCDGRVNSGGVIKGENHPWYKSGKKAIEFGHNWHKQRTNTRRRDSNTCRACGKRSFLVGLDVHHIKPRDEYDSIEALEEQGNDLSNLITLCRSCHRKAEHGTISRAHLKSLIGF